MRNLLRKSVLLKIMLCVLVLLMYAPPSLAVAGVRRRAVRRTAIVVGSSKRARTRSKQRLRNSNKRQHNNSRRLRRQRRSQRQPRHRLLRHRLRLPAKLRQQTAEHRRSRLSNNWKSCNRFTNRG